MTVPARATARATAPASLGSSIPRLTVVRSPEQARSGVPFFLFCGAILLASLVAALVLNTAMAVSSYRVHDQRIVLAQLQERYHDLDDQLDSLGSPTSLQAQAAALGMVPAGDPVYLSVGNHQVLGVNPAGGSE